jgi:isopropylmalate/homocitrate/citramalate synthase
MTVRVADTVSNDYKHRVDSFDRDDSENPRHSLNPGEPALPRRDVTIVEVGPRDGLQNEASPIPTSAKIAFVDALARARLPIIEVTSFVNPTLVPQLSDAAEVMAGIGRTPESRYLVLVPNVRGLESALQSGADAIALFTAASDEFASANVGTSIEGTFDRFHPVMATARERGLWVRGYISVAFGCPFAGQVEPGAIVSIAERLLSIGCDEICLADTVGVATPQSVRLIVDAALHAVPVTQLALHFHDTSGTALINVEASLDRGVRI